MKRLSSKMIGWKRWTAAAAVGAMLALPGTAGAATPAEQLGEVFGYIENMHISESAGDALRDAAIQGMIESLDDPYTQYYNEAQWSSLHDTYEQLMVGIGIRFVKTEEGLLVLRVYDNSAASAAGLREGDLILRVGGLEVQSHTLEELSSELVGPEGTEVLLAIVDGDSRIVEEASIVRRPFHIPTVTYEMMDGGTGYIRIDSFSSDTGELVGEALRAFEAAPNWSSLLIDIRGNPGGYLNSVQDVASHFIEQGPLLRAVGRGGKEQTIDIEGGGSVGVPVALLVDGNSASASEVFAGAMQDYKKATVVGSRTYGKGSVQQLVELETGGGLKLTVQHYLTPQRHPVNGVGIAPDVEAPSPLGAALTGLRQLGVAQFRLTLREYETEVNGAAFDDVAATVRENGATYVSARALADVLGGAAEWDGSANAVKLTAPAGSALFGAGTGLLLKDGASYVDIAALAKALPHISASASGKTVTLEWSENG